VVYCGLGNISEIRWDSTSNKPKWSFRVQSHYARPNCPAADVAKEKGWRGQRDVEAWGQRGLELKLTAIFHASLMEACNHKLTCKWCSSGAWLLRWPEFTLINHSALLPYTHTLTLSTQHPPLTQLCSESDPCPQPSLTRFYCWKNLLSDMLSVYLADTCWSTWKYPALIPDK